MTQKHPRSPKKIVLAPDSFKGSLTAGAFCRTVEAEIAARFGTATVRSLPLADGGEGTVDCFLFAAGGERVEITVSDPWGKAVRSAYAVLPDGTAVIETAASAGLVLAGPECRAAETTTYGVGETVRHALRAGHRRILLGLGGSATNDGGCGAACALGVRFLDADGVPFLPVGGTLGRIAAIDRSACEPLLAGAEIRCLCDVKNPLCGPDGASAVFGPQKGADAETVRLLDGGLFRLGALLARETGRDVREIPGAGAAGGLGAGLLALFGASLVPGIGTVLDTLAFGRELADADLVITGEGSFDLQSFSGKAVSGVAKRAKAAGVPVWIFAGRAEAAARTRCREIGAEGVWTLSEAAPSPEESRRRAARYLALTARRAFAERFPS